MCQSLQVAASSSFWDAFIPNFTATVAGVVLGIPVALWLARVGERRAQSREREEKAARLRECVELITSSLRNNAANLRDLAKLSSDRVTAFTEIELAAWDALHDEALDLIPSATLKRDLARHFEHVGRIVTMNEQRTVRMAGRIERIRMGTDRAGSFEEQWLGELKQRASTASIEAEKLIERLEKTPREPEPT